MDLFDAPKQKIVEASRPLADRMRPGNLSEFVGQAHIVGPGTLVRRAIETDRIFSMILWGPPGCGKTTLARIIAQETRSYFAQFSAVLSGVKQIRSVIEEAKKQQQVARKKTILFVDEIHRFNKAQQDAFLYHVESGLITLIGATTENPSFEVIPALMSRCRVITLSALSDDDIALVLNRALRDTERGLGNTPLDLKPEAMSHLIRIADGDVRMALNGLELAASIVMSENNALESDRALSITLPNIETALLKKALQYDKAGEEHYNLISALHKSLRGSDPDAAVYWLGRMIAAGEDPLYVARRMVRFASEDIGNADPAALTIAINAMEAFRFIGPPEGELALAQAAIYLATAPKSNSIYVAYETVKEEIVRSGTLPTPLHIRNAPTGLMKSLGYGKGYQYAHDHPEGYVAQDYLPQKLQGKQFYAPTNRGYENTVLQRLNRWRELKRKVKTRANRS